jgi:hypothetical protein
MRSRINLGANEIMKISTLPRSLAPAALGVIATLALGCPAEDTPGTDESSSTSGNDSTTDDDGTTTGSTTSGSTTSGSTTGTETDSDSDSGDSDTGVGECDSLVELALPEGAVPLSTLEEAPPPGFVNLSVPPFDTPNTNADPGLSALTTADIVFDAEEGSACPGSMGLEVPFTIYQDTNFQGQASLNVGIPAPGNDWTAFSALHVWVMVESETDLTHLNTVALSVLSGDPTADPVDFYANFTAQFTAASTLTSGTWAELVFDIPAAIAAGADPDNDPTTPPTFFVNGIGQFGVAVNIWDGPNADTTTGGTPPPVTAPAAPVTTTLYIDDVWLELAPPPP